jgi:hypothetical protein
MLLGLMVVLALGCGAAPVAPSPRVSTVTVPPSLPPTAVASAAPAAPPVATTVPMYPVARIYSLFGVTATEGGLELSLGVEPGGGISASFRYVPFVNGAPDFARETSDVSYSDTSGVGSLVLAGKRPHLLMHDVSGFRSSATERYSLLDHENAWSSSGLKEVSGIGEGIFPWTKDRLLEWRGPAREDHEAFEKPRLPRFRVVQGEDKVTPSLSRALEKRLLTSGFSLTTFTVLPTGEVMAIGYLTHANGLGTLLWTTDLKEPAYFVSAADLVKGTEHAEERVDVRLLGGTTLGNVRLQIENRVLRLEGSAWVAESTVAEGGLPDVWFGSPLVRSTETGAFARLAKDAPWTPIGVPTPQGTHAYAVDADGTIWTVEGEVLLASRKPEKMLEVTEEDLVMGRKRSLLRGGSVDVTGQPPAYFRQTTCRMHYVVLDKSPSASAPQDFPKIREALKGHTELAAAQFIVSWERDWQFFGAQIKDEATANKLSGLVDKRFKSGQVLCAEPAALREIKIDLKTGALIP